MNEIQKYHDLLHEAARLHERWRANCTEPFNVFTALRSASDEVNLHSRFLHALLNYIDPASGYRENLKAFLHEVVEEAENFQLEHARVEREANNIDLLISNGRQAVIVENKIWAADQIRQLQKSMLNTDQIIGTYGRCTLMKWPSGGTQTNTSSSATAMCRA